MKTMEMKDRISAFAIKDRAITLEWLIAFKICFMAKKYKIQTKRFSADQTGFNA